MTANHHLQRSTVTQSAPHAGQHARSRNHCERAHQNLTASREDAARSLTSQLRGWSSGAEAENYLRRLLAEAVVTGRELFGTLTGEAFGFL